MSREQMKARLEAATPGPWEWDHSNPRRVLEGKDGEQVLSCAALLYPEQRNQQFIAHAPTDLAKLHAALDAVERVCADWEKLADGDRYYAGKIRAAIRDALGEEDR